MKDISHPKYNRQWHHDLGFYLYQFMLIPNMLRVNHYPLVSYGYLELNKQTDNRWTQETVWLRYLKDVSCCFSKKNLSYVTSFKKKCLKLQPCENETEIHVLAFIKFLADIFVWNAVKEINVIFTKTI